MAGRYNMRVETPAALSMTASPAEPLESQVEPLRVVEAVSPTAKIEENADGALITIHDLHGTTTAQIDHGAVGLRGERGKQGIQGPPGERGKPGDELKRRVSSLTAQALAPGSVIEAVGIPAYLNAEALGEYSDFGLTVAGWYVFARIAAPEGVTVTAGTTVEGAAGAIIAAGADHVDVAVLFGVTAESQAVTVTWADAPEDFIFKADDLAVRNLDYRTTFYIYDIAPYAAWQYALTADATFADGKNYYTEADGVYTLAEVTAGAAVPANTYYNHSKLRLEGMVANVTYRLNGIVDCPIEIALPAVAEDGHGAWFEIQMRYDAAYSCTLLPPEGVKVGTAQTQAQGVGVNIIDLQYTDAGEVKMWTLLNTHSNIPA